jgi:hypothetical protein
MADCRRFAGDGGAGDNFQQIAAIEFRPGWRRRSHLRLLPQILLKLLMIVLADFCSPAQIVLDLSFAGECAPPALLFFQFDLCYFRAFISYAGFLFWLRHARPPGI